MTNPPSLLSLKEVLGGRTNGLITRTVPGRLGPGGHLNIRSSLYTSIFFNKILATADSGKCVRFYKQDPLRFEFWSEYFLVL